METLIASVISGGLALVGTVITVKASQRKTEAAMTTELAIMRTELSNLCKEVEKHNNFAERIPKLEAQSQANTEAITRLENFHME